MISRTDQSFLSNWWWTIDKLMLFGLISLLFLGIILSFAASPSIAEHLNLTPYFFTKRHLLFGILSFLLMITLSFLNPKYIRRFSLIVFIIGIELLIYTLFAGSEIKGAKRWIYIYGFSLQPSEFIKPVFVVLIAWLFAENTKRQDIPANIIATILFGIVVLLFIAQPDIGQTILTSLTWGSIFILAGLHWFWIIVFIALAIGNLFIAYTTIPYVANRIDRFIYPEMTDTYQIDKAKEAFLSGGWFGRGPGEGVIKRHVPDSHTDFIFAVVGEEFGIVMCIFLALIFLILIIRGLYLSFKQKDPFIRLAIAGLTIIFGLQAAINMAVSLHLTPTKGMTLPFISYGGSSLISVAICMGILLSLSRKRPPLSLE